MTADDFVAVVRKGSDKLRVDELVVNTGQHEFRGKGMLRVGQERIEIDMTLDPGQEPPPTRRSGVFTKSDYWKLSGIIEDCLRFRCDYVGSGGQQGFIGGETHKVTLTFDLNPIELIPSGWDAMSREERARIDEELRQRNDKTIQGSIPAQAPPDKQPPDGLVHFSALIANYPLPTLLCKGTEVVELNPYFGERRSSGLDTLMGEIEGYNYAFIKENDAADLQVHLKSKENYQSPGEEEDWRKFHALMKALAFTLGMHAWPYRTQYWRDGKKVADRVTPTRRLAHTVHTPFGLAHFDFQDVIRKATAFFESNSVLSKEVAYLLFLFREAANYESVNFDITVLATCVLFESLVNQLFEQLKLDNAAAKETAGLTLSEPAKLELGEHIKHQIASLVEQANSEADPKMRQQITSKQEAYRRLLTRLFDFREKFQAVVNYFQLQWKDDMEPVFRTWRAARNPLVHGARRTDQTEDESKDLMRAESLIAGAFNVLLLKLFGYSGQMSASAFEEEYRQV